MGMSNYINMLCMIALFGSLIRQPGAPIFFLCLQSAPLLLPLEPFNVAAGSIGINRDLLRLGILSLGHALLLIFLLFSQGGRVGLILGVIIVFSHAYFRTRDAAQITSGYAAMAMKNLFGKKTRTD